MHSPNDLLSHFLLELVLLQISFSYNKVNMKNSFVDTVHDVAFGSEDLKPVVTQNSR